MASLRQQHSAFVNKHGKVLHVKGRGLLPGLIYHAHGGIHERFRKMTLMGSGTVYHHQNPTLNGGAIKHHDRPYQLKDRARVEHKKIENLLQYILNHNLNPATIKFMKIIFCFGWLFHGPFII